VSEEEYLSSLLTGCFVGLVAMIEKEMNVYAGKAIAACGISVGVDRTAA